MKYTSLINAKRQIRSLTQRAKIWDILRFVSYNLSS